MTMGNKIVKVYVLKGLNGTSLVIENYRVSNEKIYGMLTPIYTFEVATDDILQAIGQKHNQSKDCVSRQAVLDLMQLKMGGKELYKAVYDLPPVTSTQSWLPVSEKLPEESGNYLLYGKVVDYEENCVFIGEYDSDYEKFGYEENIYDSETLGFLDSEFCEYNKVIAWQPLPKPYEEKRGDSDGSN